MWSGPGTTEINRGRNRSRYPFESGRGHEPGRNRGHRAVAAAVLLVVGLVLVTTGIGIGIGVAPAAATPAPAGLFGLWPHDWADPPPEGADVVAVYPAEGDTAEILPVALRFASPFTPADNGYRASVVIGDPGAGAGQLRVSYRTVDGGAVGTVERKAGEDWTDLGLIQVHGTPTDGLIVFDVPVRELETPRSLWVDIEAPSSSNATTAFVSGYFPFAAFSSDGAAAGASGQPAGGVLLARARSTSAWGQVETLGPTSLSTATSPFPLQPALKPPVLSVANRGLLVSTELPAPTGIDGSHVAGVIDRVHLVASDLGAPSPGYLQIDRASGSVDLYTVGSGEPVLVTSTDPWLGTAPDPADPGAPVTVTADLPTVARLLGLPQDVAQLAVSADRTIALDDDRTIVAVGIGATVDTISEALADGGPAVTAEGAGTPTSTTSDEGVQVGIVAIAAGIAVLVVLGVVLLLFGPGRRPGSASRTRPGDRSPDAILAALERQFSELGVEINGSSSNRTDERTATTNR